MLPGTLAAAESGSARLPLRLGMTHRRSGSNCSNYLLKREIFFEFCGARDYDPCLSLPLPTVSTADDETPTEAWTATEVPEI